jgi:hypothetical protein
MFAFLRKNILLATLLVCVLAATLMTARHASSQSGGTYDLSWNSIDGGGITFAQGGNYSLGGTVGAADAGILSGGQYVLEGGFWSGAFDKRNVYLPALRR